MLGYQNTLRQPPRTRLSSNQEAEAIERVWRMYWPYRRATIIAILILLYGLTLVGLEAAKLDVEGETDANPKTASITLPAIRLRIGVGIWSGAVIAVAAITVLIINCTSHVKHWASISLGWIAAAAVFSATNFSINAKIVQIGVVTNGFDSIQPTGYRLAAAQIAVASLSLLACLVYFVLYAIIVSIKIHPVTKRLEYLAYQG